MDTGHPHSSLSRSSFYGIRNYSLVGLRSKISLLARSTRWIPLQYDRDGITTFIVQPIAGTGFCHAGRNGPTASERDQTTAFHSAGGNRRRLTAEDNLRSPARHRNAGKPGQLRVKRGQKCPGTISELIAAPGNTHCFPTVNDMDAAVLLSDGSGCSLSFPVRKDERRKRTSALDSQNVLGLLKWLAVSGLVFARFPATVHVMSPRADVETLGPIGHEIQIPIDALCSVRRPQLASEQEGLKT